MIRCLLIDDEPLALDLVEDNLKQVNYIRVVGRCRTASEALALLQTEQVDLIFCDIHMPGLNGLQLVKSLVVKPMVIFITAYEKFAIDGFELDVLDYLVKPVPLDRFLRACQKAYQVFELKKASEQIPVISKKHIFVNSDYTLVKIMFSDIEYIEGLKDYVKINLTGKQKPLLTRISIKALELQLPAGQFYRVHKSYIINVDYVTQIRRGKIITDNSELPLSDSYRDMIHKMIGREVA
ncbi:LytR/AlgR family response regulator transcription factor [Mucilaginibacter phenanthrenivorans]|uniref:LytR/AlgR family response regulator transcription factor n=1 Tax=Mucilaginibacter phenanthrenivorans TaxID=1234842 RepID=UPI002158272A|nr:LytTR family DNA-binding domain-containing protein [Mucilaginibacter phenanthrenivorans]